MIKKCDICGVEFETVHPKYKYCSPTCGKQGAKIRDAKRRGNEIIKDCPICGKQFETKKNGALTKYCSQDCSDEARRIRNRERWRKDNPGWDEGTNKVCEFCGEKFTVPARNAHIARFCSSKCNDTWHSRQNGRLPWEEWTALATKQKQERQEKLDNEKQEAYLARLTTKKCEWCGKEFITDIPTKLTCSDECKRKRSNKRNDSRLNKENIIDSDISITKLYKRDKGICYICGGKCNFKDHTKTNGNFTVGPNYPSIDHIIPLARGGMHSWDNIKLAHHYCNAMKSDILPSELGLDIGIDDAYALAKKVSPLKKEVRQLSRGGKLIKIYESTAEASRQTGIPASTIQNNARGENKTSKHGFVFEYV